MTQYEDYSVEELRKALDTIMLYSELNDSDVAEMERILAVLRKKAPFPHPHTTEEMWFPEWDNGGLGRGYLSGSPWSGYDEAERHYANSPLKNVDKWNKPILCIHGEKDYRIPYTQGMAAFNTAQMMGVPSKLVVFPDENHWILQPPV